MPVAAGLRVTKMTCRRLSAIMSMCSLRPTFALSVEWYEAIGIGVSGGELHAIIEDHLGDPFFGIGLNPGHLIHLDEWATFANLRRLYHSIAIRHGDFKWM